ncbi:MAG: transcription antitermination factor NusB, partial [Planctomycetota bacterium]
MATPVEIREMALRLLYERDASGADADFLDPVEISEQPDRLSSGDVRKIRAAAEAAYAGRVEADRRVEELAPTWPASRQPAVDRAILRLAIAELRGGVKRAIVINEAVELAKRYSTEKSPGFINGVLDKIADRLGGVSTAAGGDAFGTPTAKAEGTGERVADGPGAPEVTEEPDAERVVQDGPRGGEPGGGEPGGGEP